MKKSSLLQTVTVFTVLMGCVVGWNILKVDDSSSIKETPALKGREFLSTPETKQPGLISDPPILKAEKTASINPLHRALLTATDLRALYEKIKIHPEEGGFYYSGVINQRCYGVNERLAAPATTDANASHALASQREAAMNKLRGQCQAFLESELSLGELYILYKSSKKDPLLNTITQLGKAVDSGDREQTKAMLTILIDLNSPELISEKLISYSEKGAYFNGVFYGNRENGDAILLTAALALAECQLGAECGANDFAVLNACAVEMICEENKEEFIKKRIQQVRKNPDADMEKITALTAQLVTAIKNKDVDKFVR